MMQAVRHAESELKGIHNAEPMAINEIVFSKTDCQSVVQVGASAQKQVILDNFKQKLNCHELVSSVTYHYSGHGTIKKDKARKEEAGAWICANGAYLYIEEIVALVVTKARRQ